MLEYKQSRIVSEKICTNAIFLAPILVWGFRNFSKSNKFYKKKNYYLCCMFPLRWRYDLISGTTLVTRLSGSKLCDLCFLIIFYIFDSRKNLCQHISRLHIIEQKQSPFPNHPTLSSSVIILVSIVIVHLVFRFEHHKFGKRLNTTNVYTEIFILLLIPCH